MSGLRRTRVLVSGRVQGVWFRGTTRDRARDLGLRGFVRNLPDGRVEALFEGDPDAVRAAVDFVRTGPPQARVSGVEVEELGDDTEPVFGPDFEIRYDR